MAEGSATDQAARFTAKVDGEGFLAWLLPGLSAAYRFRAWLDARRLPFPGGTDRECDTIAAWTHRDGLAGPLATVVEFQTRPGPRLLQRLALYATHLELDEPFQREAPVVWYDTQAAAVVLTGTTPDTLDRPFAGLGLGGVRWQFPVRCLAAESAADTLTRIEAGGAGRCVLPWVPLMAGADAPALAERWKAAGDGETIPGRRGVYRGLALVFADVAGRAILWEAALKEWSMDEDDPEIVNRWRAESREAGIAIGEQRGRQEARALAARHTRERLQRLLVRQFGPEALAEAAPHLEALDYDAVNRWFDLALDATSWPELRARWGV